MIVVSWEACMVWAGGYDCCELGGLTVVRWGYDW